MHQAGGGDKEQFWNTSKHSALFNKACSRGKLVNHEPNQYYQRLIDLEKENAQLQSTPAVLPHLRGEKILETLMKFTVQSIGLLKEWALIIGL